MTNRTTSTPAPPPVAAVAARPGKVTGAKAAVVRKPDARFPGQQEADPVQATERCSFTAAGRLIAFTGLLYRGDRSANVAELRTSDTWPAAVGSNPKARP